MDSPRRPDDMQRWFRFKNVGTAKIPAYAVIGPQADSQDEYDAIETSSEVDYQLRLGRASAASSQGQDASLFYFNGSQEIQPKKLGRCTQYGMMQALIGYPTDSPPSWGDGLSIDTSQTSTPFYLVPGSGAYRFIDFDGCPKTTFKDSTRTGYTFKVAWIVPASQGTVLDGAIIKDAGTDVTLEAGGILLYSGSNSENPDLVPFGLSDALPYSSETNDLKTRGFHRINTTGNYLLNFTARIRSTDSDINTSIPSTLRLTVRTNRVGESDVFNTADQVEALAAAGELDEESADYIFRKLQVTAEEQPADTNLVEGEVTEKRRHYQTVTGSTVLSLTEGELLFIYNPTSYEIEVSSVSGTLVLLSGVSAGVGSSTSSTSSESSGSSGDGASSEEVAALSARVTTAESDIDGLESDVGTLEATVTSQGVTIASHTTSIATNASGISANAADITAAESDIAALETFQATTEAIFAAAVSDGAKTTASGDSITVTDGIITAFAAGPYALPSSDGTSGQVLTTDGAGGWTFEDVSSFSLVEESGSAFRPVTDSATTLGDGTHAWSNGYFDVLTLGGVNLDTRIGSIETDVTAAEADIDALEGYFSGVIANGTYTTAARDTITVANGLITAFNDGPNLLPATSGSNKQFLQTNGSGTTTWATAVHQYWTEVGAGYLVPITDNTYDLGLPSQRPRDLRVARNGYFGGVIDAYGAGFNYVHSLGTTLGQLNGNGLLARVDSGDTEHDVNVGAGFAFASGADRKALGLLTINTNGGLTKRLDASWASGHGSGGMAAGTVANNTTYYIHLIENNSTGVCDVMFDTSATADNIPSGYTRYRSVGIVKTDGSANIDYVLSTANLGGVYYPTNDELSDGDYLSYNATQGKFVPTSAPTSTVPHHVGHRLTPSSSEPYVTTDDTGNSILYLLPHRDNLARLYTGSAWVLEAISSLSFNLSTDNDVDAASIASSSAYDVFIDYNGGTPQLALKKWTSAGYGSSARATNLTRQDGVWVLTGATDHLYVGSILTNSSTQLDLSVDKCKIWNYYNQEPHYFLVDSSTSHTYNGAYRAWNNDTSLRVEFILGLKQTLTILGNFAAWDNAPNHGGVQLDATTGTPLETVENRAAAFYRQPLTAMSKAAAAGAHYLQAVEGTESGGTTTFYEAKLEFAIMA